MLIASEGKGTPPRWVRYAVHAPDKQRRPRNQMPTENGSTGVQFRDKA